MSSRLDELFGSDFRREARISAEVILLCFLGLFGVFVWGSRPIYGGVTTPESTLVRGGILMLIITFTLRMIPRRE